MPRKNLDHDAPDELDKIAAGRAVISRRETAWALNRAPETLDGWIARQLFPPWLQQTPGGPKEQRVEVVRAWLTKRKRARYQPPTKRGQLKRGTKLGARNG